MSNRRRSEAAGRGVQRGWIPLSAWGSFCPVAVRLAQVSDQADERDGISIPL